MSDSFVDPSTLTPLFTAQQNTCAYPISDFYAQPPRYLYYALLAACFISQWKGWLAEVFLGGAAAYAGVASIQAFILRASPTRVAAPQRLTIPLVNSTSNLTRADGLQALVTDQTELLIQPFALELDVDPILAITVVGCLVALPVQVWSHVVRANRARYLVITLWNILVFAGSITALSLWSRTFDTPDQYRFCYPSFPDPASINRDSWPNSAWRGDWNTTVWTLFSDLNQAELLSDNCFYPCFNTSQILRRSSSLTASVYSANGSPRLSARDMDRAPPKVLLLPNLVYVAINLSIAMTVFLLVASQLGISRISATEPRLLWAQKRELWQTLSTEFVSGLQTLYQSCRAPRESCRMLSTMPRRQVLDRSHKFTRFFLDLFTLFILVMAMIISPLTVVAFLVCIEVFITQDGFSGETPSQVGQWSTSVSIALVLVSALIYRLRYVIASKADIQSEIREVRDHLLKLEALLDVKEKV